MFKKQSITLFLMGLGLLDVNMGPALAGPPSWGGDLRFGYYASMEAKPDGTDVRSESLLGRVRLGGLFPVGERVTTSVRFAGRYSTTQTSTGFAVLPYNNTTGKFGQATLDKLNLTYRISDDWQLRAGRLQTKFELVGVPKKSLDRNDSPNMDIDFTDGLYLIGNSASGWTRHFILQHNPPEGSTNVTRGPLDYSDPATQATLFLGLENKQASGRFIQRGIDLTYIPAALLVDGAKREYYLGLVGRAAMRWPLSGNNEGFILGMELGYAPNTPQNDQLGIGGTERAGGLAFQTSFNWMNFRPGQSIGLVVGQAQGGWLLSPDFPQNMQLLELRHKWVFSNKLRLETRVRQRLELAQQTGAGVVRKRDRRDLYVRLTYKLK